MPKMFITLYFGGFVSMDSGELSPLVRSVSVVMMNFNVSGRFLVPKWIEAVEERQGDGPRSRRGIKLLSHHQARMCFTPSDIESLGFTPLRLRVISRSNPVRTRMTLVMVRNSEIKDGEERMPRKDEAHLHKVLLEKIWRVTIYRNSNDRDGNFVIEACNPRSPESLDSILDLRADEDLPGFRLLKKEKKDEHTKSRKQGLGIIRRLMAS